MKFDDLDGQMRRFELSFDRYLPVDQFTVARLDGRGFTRLTKVELGFERPFDSRFHDAIISTSRHLMDAGFQIALCYTQSDEISLLLDKNDDVFQRKERKLISILAGEASGVFSLALGHPVSFDCRLCLLPTAENVIDYFRWRTEDARRNALSAYCYWTLLGEGALPAEVDRKLAGLSAEEKRNLLRKRGIDFEAQEDWKRAGSLLRWEQYGHPGRNPKTGENVTALRRRIEEKAPPQDGEALAAIVTNAITQMESRGAFGL